MMILLYSYILCFIINTDIEQSLIKNIINYLTLLTISFIIYNLNINAVDNLFLLAMFYIFLLMSVSDILTLTVPYKYSFFYLLIVILNENLINLKIMFLAFLVFVSLTLFEKIISKIYKVETSLGGADILVLSITTIFLGVIYTYYSLFIAATLALIYLKIRKMSKEIYFIPFICFSIILNYLLKSIGG